METSVNLFRMQTRLYNQMTVEGTIWNENDKLTLIQPRTDSKFGVGILLVNKHLEVA